MARQGPFRRQRWSTQVTDVRTGQLLEVIEGRDAAAPAAWLATGDPDWLEGIEWACLDPSGSLPSRLRHDTAACHPGRRHRDTFVHLRRKLRLNDMVPMECAALWPRPRTAAMVALWHEDYH